MCLSSFLWWELYLDFYFIEFTSTTGKILMFQQINWMNWNIIFGNCDDVHCAMDGWLYPAFHAFSIIIYFLPFISIVNTDTTVLKLCCYISYSYCICTYYQHCTFPVCKFAIWQETWVKFLFVFYHLNGKLKRYFLIILCNWVGEVILNRIFS